MGCPKAQRHFATGKEMDKEGIGGGDTTRSGVDKRWSVAAAVIGRRCYVGVGVSFAQA